ncbi:MAG: sugar phosphate isomerase/epimerase, partial [Algoriphagus sp.]
MKNSCILLLLALAGFFVPKQVIAQKKGDPLFQVPLGIASYPFRDQCKNGVRESRDIIQKMGFKTYEG